MEATWWTRPEQLDAEQKNVVALPLEGNHLVLGPPGSGKTNLVLLRGAYLSANRLNNFKVLTFGRVLREFLVGGSDVTNIEDGKIDTYVGWASDILDGYGIKFRGAKKFDDVRKAILAGLQSLDEDQIRECRLDCVMLDECQDYSSDEVEIIAKLADRIFAAGDSKQKIYSSAGGVSKLKELCPSVSTLTYHYRNGQKICRVADGIAKLVGDKDGLEATRQYIEADAPSSAVFHPSEQLADQVARAIPTISDQLRAYPTSIIGVVCPLRQDVKDVWELLSRSHLQAQVQLQLGESGYSAFDPERRVIVTTAHGAKGLEFRAVHALAMEGISRMPRHQVRLAYTVVTRAKTSLAIYRSGALIGALQNGETALEPPAPAKVALQDLFRN